MKQNITISLEKDLIKKARIISAKRSTSISKMLSEELLKIIDTEDRYNAAKARGLAELKNGLHLGGRITVSRDELHER